MKKLPKTTKFIFYLVFFKNCASEHLDVTIEQGTVRGYNRDQNDVFSFYGIPYATVPKGELRFLAPLPPRAWDGIFEATDDNTICLQQTFISDKYYNFKRRLECLNINIFTPKGNVEKLPVFVVIHAGGFINGYAMKMSPIELTKKGIVTVTFNYRVGVLGYMCLGTNKVPGNAGLKDQVAALKWIQKNIKNFGGDPTKVTIAGCSSGASNTEALVVSPITKGLFSQAILESGTLLHVDLEVTDHLKTALDQANALGCNCTTEEDVEEFYNHHDNEIFNEKIHTPGFLPCVEHIDLDIASERVLVEAPIKTLIRGNFNKVPILVGFTPTEGMYTMHLYEENRNILAEDLVSMLPNSLKFLDRQEANKVTFMLEDLYFPGDITEKNYIDFITDMYIVYPLYVFARLHSRSATSNVFMYSFNFRGTVALPDVDLELGQGHAAETLYYLDYDVRNIYRNENDADRVVKERMREYYYNFITNGNPNLKDSENNNSTWLPFKEDNFYYMVIDRKDVLRQKPMPETFKVWNEIYRKQFDLTTTTTTTTTTITTTITTTTTPKRPQQQQHQDDRDRENLIKVIKKFFLEKKGRHVN